MSTARPEAVCAIIPPSAAPLERGRPYPLGAQWDGLGVNFAVYAAHATRVQLALFESPDATSAARTLDLAERTGPIWHGYLPHAQPGLHYGLRAEGPFSPEDGHRYNPNKLLLDPYAKAIGRPLRWDDSLYGYPIGHPDADLAFDERDSAPFAPLGVVTADAFEWGYDRPLGIPWEDTVIYETHVKGLTQLHPDVPEHERGTYLGVIAEPVLDHLKGLGVTTVQLLPIHAMVHDERLIKMGLDNYWGYNTLSYFAPEPAYACHGGANAVRDVKQMVRGLHAAGLEVIIDVVYNHTGEGNRFGPTLSFKGLDNHAYYKSHPENARFYMDYTGTGNTLHAGNPHVLQLIMDSLRYWVTEMHVDGFRFDLAAALARDLYEINMLSAFFQVIQQDPVLSQVKLIAEPWDVGPGGYQVGSFPWQWTEWNGRYRDAMRQYWRGDGGMRGEVATRFAGSSDLYARSGRSPSASINFVTAHDGYTLQDLVSYEQKHNEANGEDNRDGHEPNYGINFGVEGPTDDAAIREKRFALKRSLVASLMLSQGVPMLLGGDELSKTQRGNNNAYCQDNEINWYDWNLDADEEDFLDFVRQAIAFRRAHASFRRRAYFTKAEKGAGVREAVWWHPKGREMTQRDWTNGGTEALGMILRGDRLYDTDERGQQKQDDTFLVCLNPTRKAKPFVLPDDDLILGCSAWESEAPFTGSGGVRRFAPGDSAKVDARTVQVYRCA